jgi:phage shock protein PspC (stress-responsive transcriptional regulator)
MCGALSRRQAEGMNTNPNPVASDTTTAGPLPGEQPGDAPHAPDAATASRSHARSLCRPYRDRMLAGVAIGIADYLGVDVLIVRIALAVLALVGGAGLPIYLAGWLLIPEEGASQSIASELINSWSARSS